MTTLRTRPVSGRRGDRMLAHRAGSFVYDFLVIGSSPVSLCKALILAESGQQVCIIERNDRLGGAWATEDCLGLTDVETSPHIIMPDRIANTILKDLFPDLFREVEREAKEVFFSQRYGQLVVPLRDSLKVSLVRHFIGYIENRSHRLPAAALIFLARSAFSAAKRWRHNRCTTIYPRGGLSGWFQVLQARLQKSGARIHRNSTVKSLHIDTLAGSDPDHYNTVRLDDGTVLRARKILITNALEVEQLTIDGEILPIRHEQRVSQHLTMLVSGHSAGEFWSLYGDDCFEMVNDVTAFTPVGQCLAAEQKIITARLNSKKTYTEADFHRYAARLGEIGYLQSGFTIQDHFSRTLHQKRLSTETRQQIEKLSKQTCLLLQAGERGIDTALRTYCR